MSIAPLWEEEFTRSVLAKSFSAPLEAFIHDVRTQMEGGFGLCDKFADKKFINIEVMADGVQRAINILDVTYGITLYISPSRPQLSRS